MDKKTKAEKLASLTPLQFYVTQENATEKPFQGEYNDFYEEGIYVDIVSGEPLFSSLDKYNAGCGWPSFTQPIPNIALTELPDYSIIGRPRTEVRSQQADSHLGHVFTDGPKDSTGLRYCINSAALRFIPKAELVSSGYGAYLTLFEK